MTAARANAWSGMTKQERSDEMKRRRQVAANRKLQLTPKNSAARPVSVLDKVKSLFEEIEAEIAVTANKIQRIQLDLQTAQTELANLSAMRNRLAAAGGDNEA
jgi:hypothetical protein